MKNVEEVIKKLLSNNEDNQGIFDFGTYDKGHFEGYHDALVDLMNELGIKHNEKYYND